MMFVGSLPAVASERNFSSTPNNGAAEVSPAAVESGKGDIIVTVVNQQGKPVLGVRVELILPGKDGSLDKLPNIQFDVTDGTKNDSDKAADGAVLFSSTDINPYIKKGQAFVAEISAAGYIPEKTSRNEYDSEQADRVQVTLKPFKAGTKEKLSR